jgi:hypothetical protein
MKHAAAHFSWTACGAEHPKETDVHVRMRAREDPIINILS